MYANIGPMNIHCILMFNQSIGFIASGCAYRQHWDNHLQRKHPVTQLGHLVCNSFINDSLCFVPNHRLSLESFQATFFPILIWQLEY